MSASELQTTVGAASTNRDGALALIAAAGIGFSSCLLVAAPSAIAQTAPETYAKLDATGFSIIVKLTVVPKQRENFLRVMKARIEDSRTHPAVVDFRMLATPDPQVFLGYESFTTRAAFDQFATTAQSKAFLTEMKPILAQNIEVTTLSPLP